MSLIFSVWCLYVCACTCTRPVGTWAEAKGESQVACPSFFCHISFRRGPIFQWGWLTSEWFPYLHLPEHWGHRHGCSYLAFTWMLGNPTRVLMPVQQAILSAEPSPWMFYLNVLYLVSCGGRYTTAYHVQNPNCTLDMSKFSVWKAQLNGDETKSKSEPGSGLSVTSIYYQKLIQHFCHANKLCLQVRSLHCHGENANATKHSCLKTHNSHLKVQCC